MKGELTTRFGGNSISLRDGASALFSCRGLVLFTSLAVLPGTAVVTWLLPNKYESRMKILEYIDRLELEARILLRTIPAILLAKGASLLAKGAS